MRRIPTEVGDVLVMRTTQSFTIHVIGHVSKAGQLDLGGAAGIRHESAYEAALTQAGILVLPGRRVFVHDIDAGEWCEVALPIPETRCIE